MSNGIDDLIENLLGRRDIPTDINNRVLFAMMLELRESFRVGMAEIQARQENFDTRIVTLEEMHKKQEGFKHFISEWGKPVITGLILTALVYLIYGAP